MEEFKLHKLALNIAIQLFIASINIYNNEVYFYDDV